MDTPPESTVTPTSAIKPPHDEARGRDPQLSVIATAAGTSAIVSLLTLWLWTPVPPRVDGAGGTVSVSYEPLDQERAQDGRSEAAVEPAPIAGARSTRGGSGVVTAAARRAAADDNLDDVSVSRVRITTQPEGASVTINGVGYGTTPLAIAYVPPGAKRIRVTKAGYETEERFFSSDVGRASPLRITLREIREVPRNSTR